jgi:DNA-binding transcriptional MerR regulator
MSDVPKEMKLADLAKRSGVPARTIRLYVSMGLLPGPLRVGRNAAYGAEHLDILCKIRQLQRSGLTLHQMREVLHGEKTTEVASQPSFSRWREYELTPFLRILLREDHAPSTVRVLQRMVREFQDKDTPRTDEEANHDEE